MQNADGVYEEILEGTSPHSYAGLSRIVAYISGAYEVVRRRIILCRRADPAIRPNSRHVYPPAVFGPGRNIRAEERDLLVRIRTLLEELNSLQLEQLQYYCNLENGHDWEAQPDQGIEVCVDCNAQRVLVSSESSSAAEELLS